MGRNRGNSQNIFKSLLTGPKERLRVKIRAGLKTLVVDTERDSTERKEFIKNTEAALKNPGLNKEALHDVLNKVNNEIKKQEEKDTLILKEKIRASLETLAVEIRKETSDPNALETFAVEIRKDTSDPNAFANASIINTVDVRMKKYEDYKKGIEKKITRFLY